MRRLKALRASVAVLPVLVLCAFAWWRSAASTPVQAALNSAIPLEIVPIVVLQPGESREILLSTHCTVGATRSGGFGIVEMIDGEPVSDDETGHDGASYARDGVTISVLGWDDADAFAASAPYAAVHEQGIQVFPVTVSATDDAEPGLMEVHLIDSTCSGNCRTNLRVLVTAP